MKLPLAYRHSLRGSTYITVLWITLLAGIVLASYLSMVGTQNSLSMRSQSWNRCIAVAEAGAEEALTHLNINGASNNNSYRNGWLH